MVIFALLIFNGLAVSASIIIISVLSMKPRPRMPGWLNRWVSKSEKYSVKKNPDSDPAAIEGSQSSPGDVKKCSQCSSDPEQEQLDEKWKQFANSINNFLFLLFSITLVILLSVIFAVWNLAAKSAS